MANNWTKSADWIPYTNALADVNYMLQSIASSEESLLSMEEMGVPVTDEGYQQTVSEIGNKRRLLEIYRFKVKRSWARITATDKLAWKSKIPPLTVK